MAVDVSVFESRNLAYARFHGNVTPVDNLRAFDSILTDPRTRADTAHLADLSAVNDMETDFLQTLSLVATQTRLTGRVLPGTRYAVFAPDDLTFGAARMFHQIAETALPYQIEVFRREAPALAHLRQPERSISDFLIAAE
ncbi:hypothetical protein [Salipiger abyssi]|uniref:hypothetical protein n=1 Tax=Salipiger abyssi TaxID=1250539 RepID=UPI001A8E546A|nr:hypothetical protein [Salipiger abyssi]MBN9889010.1 hypothetical protein [Salipiger abyssi]